MSKSPKSKSLKPMPSSGFPGQPEIRKISGATSCDLFSYLGQVSGLDLTCMGIELVELAYNEAWLWQVDGLCWHLTVSAHESATVTISPEPEIWLNASELAQLDRYTFSPQQFRLIAQTIWSRQEHWRVHGGRYGWDSPPTPQTLPMDAYRRWAFWEGMDFPDADVRRG